MRTSGIACLIFAMCSLLPGTAAPIAEWNFNSAAADADPLSGSLIISQGEGGFTVVGGATPIFGAVGGSRTSDPVLTDNSQLRLRSLPAIDAANKATGVELIVATVGYEKLTLSWDQFNSRTASRYWRVQYSTDGLGWTDHEVVANTNASTWVSLRVTFADVTAVNNRPHLRIRLVQEFESTATGAGADAYAAVDPTATYSTAGSWWLDMVSIAGRVIGATNTPPTISSIMDVVLEEGSSAEPISFQVNDAESAPELLDVAAVASDPAVVSSIQIEGEGSDRSIAIGPGAPGETDVTIRVTDEEGDSSETRFKVQVFAEPPAVAANFFVLWNFNGSMADADATTGTFDPTTGKGTLSVVGASSHSFGTVGQGRTSDPAPDDNSMLRISGFPRQGEANKSAGIEFLAGTAGMRDITLVWDHYNSSSASRHWQVQYTTNGLEFLDHVRFTNTSASAWQRQRTVSFKDIPGAANNPNFGIRLVAVFASDAGYAAVSEGSNYSTAGTLWLDMIGLGGKRIEGEPESPPALKISNSSELILSWRSSARDFVLEAKEQWEGDWIELGTPAEEADGEFQFRAEPHGETRFFRLRQSSTP